MIGSIDVTLWLNIEHKREHVATLQLPPYEVLPEVLLWRDRVFVNEPASTDYYEASFCKVTDRLPQQQARTGG